MKIIYGVIIVCVLIFPIQNGLYLTKNDKSGGVYLERPGF